MAKDDQQVMIDDKSSVNHNNNNNNNIENNCMSCTPPTVANDHNKTITMSANRCPSAAINHHRVSLQRLSSESRAKRVKFFINGDKFFKGYIYVFNDKTIRTFDALIQDLNRLFRHQIGLPSGVRYIFTIDGGERVSSLEQLNQSMSYVCSSADNYIRLDYESFCNISNVCANSSVSLKNHSIINNTKKSIHEINTDNQLTTPSATLPLNSSHINSCLTQSLQTSSVSSSSSTASPTPKAPPDFIRPKIVTIMKNGVKPRKMFRLLLNKKTAQTYDKVLNDISNTIKLDSGALRKIYTLSGNQVLCLSDFFTDDEIFIAFGSEKYSHEDLDLDPEENKLLNSFKTSSLTRNLCNRSSSKKTTSGSPLSVIYGSISNGKGVNTTNNQNSPKIGSKVKEKNSRNIALNGNYLYNGNTNGNGYSISILFPKQVTQLYEIGQIIGDGNFAVVHQCSHKTTGAHFALKIINKSKCKGKEALIASEVAILRKVKHQNIIQLIEDFDYANELYLVMELVKGGDLFDAITLANKYTEVDASHMIHDLAGALQYLHSMNIVHRDVKPENLLIYEKNCVKSLKLGDFGLAVEMEDNLLLYSVCGTPTYVAPEILAETGYGKQVDIWAAGVIAYILLCGFPPFANEDNDQDLLFDQILSGSFEFTEPYWEPISDSAKHLITRMLEVEPIRRLTATEVLEHPWVAVGITYFNQW
ncbi:serine/threonine-protein kinase DCLK1-like isoform X2 [Oppia nitens]|uniref:serine/threonine-protein kinase DCLK1-like isoform X2 n=1 Tax=Oppia nitens TaxID=1686743 RepID=UPI0023DC457B|nr:serine/threonine-protein kinase DCLK1-like isoform X2 [Oppia nitens]